MAIRKSASSGIPSGLTAGRPANAGYGQLYANGETARLEIYTQASGWQNIVQETPGVASASGTYSESPSSGTFTISGTNFVSGAIAYAVGTNGVEVEADTTTYNSLVQLTATFTGLSTSYEPYDIKVINPSNLFGLLPDAFYINRSPVWTTSSGSLGSAYGGLSFSYQLASTDNESNSRTYTSSNLPSWLSLSSSGLLSGTTPTISSNTTYNFDVSISDGINSAVSRAFSISGVAVPTISGGTLTSDSTYYYRTFTGNGNLVVSTTSLSADILTIAGGGGGGSGYYAGGAGAGGVLYSSSVTVPVASHSIVIGGGGNGSTYTTTTGSNGTNSTLGSLTTAVGGGGAGSRDSRSGKTGNDGGSGGGCAFPNTSGGLGTSGQGNNGGSCMSGGYGASGGGAGAVGNDGPGSPYGANGGIGTNTYSSWATATSTGESGYYGGGGAAGSEASIIRAGGLGGGGAASNTSSQAAGNGSSNTGGGGGGGSSVESQGGTSASGTYQRGGNGGSGLVIVRYTKASVGG